MDRSSRYRFERYLACAIGAACLVVATATSWAADTGAAQGAGQEALEAAGAQAGGASEPDLGAGNRLTRAVEDGDHVDELPKELRGIEVIEKVGETVPMDLVFRDERGEQVELSRYLDGKLPVILTFNYSSCPLLCSVQLNALVESMKQIQLEVGQQYRIVTISLDPNETPEIAAGFKKGYVAAFPEEARDQVRAGWHFLTGEERTIRALADAVGFRYRYLERTKEYVHPASLIFLSPRGIVTRYFHGIDYRPEQLDVSIFKAGAGEHGVSLGFILACLHYDAEAGSYARTGERIMRYGALGIAALTLAGFGLWQLLRARRARQEVA